MWSEIVVLAAEALLLLALVKPGGKLFQQLPGVARLGCATQHTMLMLVLGISAPPMGLTR